jgi:hypothetical protein
MLLTNKHFDLFSERIQKESLSAIAVPARREPPDQQATQRHFYSQKNRIFFYSPLPKKQAEGGGGLSQTATGIHVTLVAD